MDIHCYGNGMFIGDICRRRVLMTYSNGYLHVMSAHATTEHTTPDDTSQNTHTYAQTPRSRLR